MVKDVIIAALTARVVMEWDFFITPTPTDKALLFGILVVLNMIGVVAVEGWVEQLRRIFERR